MKELDLQKIVDKAEGIAEVPPGWWRLTGPVKVDRPLRIVGREPLNTRLYRGDFRGPMISMLHRGNQLERFGVENEKSGDDAVVYASEEQCGQKELNIRGFTNVGLRLGDGGANLNNFVSENCYIRGEKGSVGVVVNAKATENVVFRSLNIMGRDRDNPMKHLVVIERGHIVLEHLVTDNCEDYAIVNNGGSVFMMNPSTECPLLMTTAWTRQSRQSIITGGDLRILGGEKGKEAIRWRPSGDPNAVLLIQGVTAKSKYGSVFKAYAGRIERSACDFQNVSVDS